VKLSTLLRDAGIEARSSAADDPDVVQVEYDSRRVRRGSVFVAIPGFHADGHRFAADAVGRGAVAVVAERPPEPAVPVGTPLFIAGDSRVALSALAAAIHGRPSRRLCVAGVTGTDGKTSTVTLLWAAWRAGGIAAGSLSTVDHRVGDKIVDNKSRQTTLEAPELQAALVDLAAAGCSHVALETSSHALELHRVDDIDFRIAVYTRITSEHLELHGSRERYLEVKGRLLDAVSTRPDGIAVLNAGDEFAFARLARVPVATRLTYSGDPAIAADLVAHDVRADARGVRFTAATPWGSTPVSLQLAGRFNVENALAALAAACATGAPLDAAADGLAALSRVRGRMERIDLGQPFAAVVDYAHTTESLAVVLTELRAATPGQLWVVFGSAGERDVEKRPAMGAVAARLADRVVITDEDPREEDRERILEEIAAGATAAGGVRGETVVVIPDRTEAIRTAVARAAPGDTVVFAGKGHEGSLIMGKEALPWDERAVVEAAIRERLGR
jgi:UDP-N-acetylmuramoyl-L-alanyl-D-glutamate--2,6-diaminopimelate ligase